MSGSGPSGTNPEQGSRPAADDLRGHAGVLESLDPGFVDRSDEPAEPEERRRKPDSLSGRPDIDARDEPRQTRQEPAERDENALDMDDYSVLFGDDPPENEQHPQRSDPDAFELDLPDGSKLSSKELKELRDSGLRLADYTRKTKEVGEARRGLEQRHAGLEKQEESLTQRFSQVMFILQNTLPANPPGEMAYTQPQTYLQQKASYDAAVAKVQQLNDVYFAHQKQREQALALANQEYARSEAMALKEFFPQLNDRERATRFVDEIARGVEYYCFDRNDVNATMDSRIWRMAADAIMHRKNAERLKRPNRDGRNGQFVSKEQPRAQTVRPSARVSQAQQRTQNYKRDREALHKSGSLQDAARVIAALDKD
jgi:hypothetical protein